MTDEIARLVELSERATNLLLAGNYLAGVQAEIDFRAVLATWFRAHQEGLKEGK